ncbi:MAG TPA: hypothetical protein VK249_34760 [Anaerolineales bacterium]|nr:hypothetical protein [Anaerolineales bacterium]
MRSFGSLNTAWTRPLREYPDHNGGTRRVFRQFGWLEVGPGKAALSHPAYQPFTPTGRFAGVLTQRVAQAVSPFSAKTKYD